GSNQVEPIAENLVFLLFRGICRDAAPFLRYLNNPVVAELDIEGRRQAGNPFVESGILSNAGDKVPGFALEALINEVNLLLISSGLLPVILAVNYTEDVGECPGV